MSEENTNTIQQEENAAKPEKVAEVAKEPVENAKEPSESSENDPNKATKAPWFQKRIDQLTAEKWEERRAAEALKKSNEALLAQLAEIRTAGTAQQDPNAQVAAPVNPAVQTKADPALSEAEIEARAIRKAEEISIKKAFDKACNDTYTAGKDEYPDFDRALGTFQMLGGIPHNLMELTSEMPLGHKILYTLGKDPDLAEKIVKMSPTKQAMELARLESSLSKPASKKISKAEEPITPIEGGGGRAEESPETMSMADYVKWREKTARKR